jgi:hypothetical protein
VGRLRRVLCTGAVCARQAMACVGSVCGARAGRYAARRHAPRDASTITKPHAAVCSRGWAQRWRTHADGLCPASLSSLATWDPMWLPPRGCAPPTPRVSPATQVACLPPRNVRNDNFLQRLLVTWVYAVIDAGRRGRLQQDALRMPADQATEVAADRFLKEWSKERARAKTAANTSYNGSNGGGSGGGERRGGRGPSLWRALWRSYGGQFMLAGVFKLLWSTFVLLGASYFVNALIEFVQGKMAGAHVLPGKGVGWVSGCRVHRRCCWGPLPAKIAAAHLLFAFADMHSLARAAALASRERRHLVALGAPSHAVSRFCPPHSSWTRCFRAWRCSAWATWPYE